MRPIEEFRVNRRRREVLRQQRHDVRSAGSITDLLRSEALQSETRVPDIEALVDSAARALQGTSAMSAATPAAPATSVRILGELSRDGAIVETAEITQLLGRRSTRSAALYFTRDAAQHPLRVRAISSLVP